MNREYFKKLRQIIGEKVRIIVDRPIMSYHPEYPELYYTDISKKQ